MTKPMIIASGVGARAVLRSSSFKLRQSPQLAHTVTVRTSRARRLAIPIVGGLGSGAGLSVLIAVAPLIASATR